MRKITMVACDNPTCPKIGDPEPGRNRPPYGWLVARGGWFGCGPDFDVCVCGRDCLWGAIDDAVSEL